jgi:methionyl-tRNA synthetase
VFYVWFDAPIGYISITKKGREDWRRWWLNADETELYQFMAKDNIPFHTVMFPASLIGSGQPWTLLHHISSTEYLNYEDDKFSKSRGVGVFGNDAIETGIPADLWRFYLIATRPERSDSSFQWHHFFEKVNSEFINNIGNLANRSLTYLSKQFDGEVTREPWDESQLQVFQQLGETIAKVTKAMEQVQLRQALQELLNIGHLANKYYQDAAPWACLKTDRKAAHRIASLPVYVLRSLSILLAPVMPQTAGDLQGILQIHDFSWETASSFTGLEGHFIGKPYILYHLLDESLAEQFRKRFSGQSSEDVSSPGSTPKLVAGRITTVSRHPEADKLYILTVDLNDHQRQVVAGLAPQWTPEELLGKTIVLVANLASATIRGQSSEGMILAAEQGKKKELLQTKEAPGKVLWDSPDEVIQLDEFKRYGLHVDQFQLCGPQGPLHPESPKVHTTLLVRAKVR